MELQILEPSSPQWSSLLESEAHDFYHLPGYVALEASRLGGKGVAFLAQEGEYYFFLPLILRQIQVLNGPVPGMEKAQDALSPYGYPSPLFRAEGAGAEDFLSAAVSALKEKMAELGVGCAFVRCHPLFPLPENALREYGKLLLQGETVWIDLTRTREELWHQLRPRYRTYLNSLRRRGVNAYLDESFTAIDRFVNIYYQTMDRVKAASWYYFDREYFHELKERLGKTLKLGIVEEKERIECAGLFTNCQGVVQYHLSGTSEIKKGGHYLKFLLHFMSCWAKEEGASKMHLGGGVGGAADELLHFKAGFSPLRAHFYTWRAVFQPEIFEAAVRCWEERAHTKMAKDETFFPPYSKPRISPGQRLPPPGASAPLASRSG